jgi:threonine synthase
MTGSLLERYRAVLPLGEATPLVSLGEGGTPLVRAERISERLGLDVRLKWEGANPTGSFKDRGMAVAVSKALEAGAPGVVCASTGNTAASAAAYAARAGIEAVIVHAAGAVAAGKLVQVRAAGARLLPVEGSFEDAFAAALALAEEAGYTFVNSTNPHRLEGQKTAAYELVEQLGAPPDVLALPYGGGGNTAAYFKGFSEAGGQLPRFLPTQAAERPTTVASAIRIGAPVHADEVEEAVAATGGEILTVADRELVAAWRTLAQEEGLFCEPASAASVAGLAHAGLEPGTRVVCVLTGHGLKDTGSFDELIASG